jgi:hypothetical protein
MDTYSSRWTCDLANSRQHWRHQMTTIRNVDTTTRRAAGIGLAPAAPGHDVATQNATLAIETAVLWRLYEAVFNQKNLDVVDELYATDFIDHTPGAPQGSTGAKQTTVAATPRPRNVAPHLVDATALTKPPAVFSVVGRDFTPRGRVYLAIYDVSVEKDRLRSTPTHVRRINAWTPRRSPWQQRDETSRSVLPVRPATSGRPNVSWPRATHC